MNHLTRALRHRNFRLYLGGQGLSLIGTWMTQIATSWLIYRLSHSAFLLGLAGFSSQIPVFAFSAFTGVWMDRLNLQRVMIFTQIFSMIESLVLAFLTLTHRITIHEIIILGFLQGLINVFDMPARQAFVVQMVDDKKDLGNAIAINSFTFNLARLIGPMFAGLLIAATGEGMCFLIDGISYIAVVASLLMMTLKPFEKGRTHPGILHQFKEGARYAFGFKPIRNVLMLMVLFSLMGMTYTVLMPVYAADVFQGGAHTMGFLLGALGIGALIGSIFLAARKTVVGLGKVMVTSGILFAIVIMVFSFSRIWWLSLTMLALSGYALIMIVASANTFLQTVVEDDKRGRLMGLFTLAFIGMTPFGSLLAGGSAKYVGAPWTLFLSAVFCLAGTWVFATHLDSMKKLVRPIYLEKGILPG